MVHLKCTLRSIGIIIVFKIFPRNIFVNKCLCADIDVLQIFFIKVDIGRYKAF